MNPDQFNQLLAVLIKIADKRHAITEAVDWPMLAAMVTLFGGIVIALIGAMWIDLKRGYERQRQCADKDHDLIRKDFEKDIANLKKDIEDCQEDCCPPRMKRE